MNHPIPTHPPETDSSPAVRTRPVPVAGLGRDDDDIGWPRRSADDGARSTAPVRLARRVRAYLALRIMAAGPPRS